jgi:dihydrofolate synthase/folylpolyglutamate synthase
MYQRQGQKAYKADLSNTLLLDDHLKNPANSFRTLHVAGTNGKGSVSHMLAAILQQAGYRTGLYTSPHLKDFRERIRVNGTMIPKADVVRFVQANRSFFEAHELSFFEMTVGMAFDHFRDRKVDIAVIEVGLGGRLDSTNIITPEVSVITNISFDHMEFLGNTLKAIASEKAGIIKPNIPVVIGETTPETREVFEEVAKMQAAPIYFAEEKEPAGYSSDLKGSYQKKNIRTTLEVVEVLRMANWTLNEEVVRTALLRVRDLTGMQGRWQWLGKDPVIVCDTAHNEAGLREVMAQLREQQYRQLHIVLGMVKEKELDKILPLFPETAIYYYCRPDIPRGMAVTQLKAAGDLLGLKGMMFDSVTEAFAAARGHARKDDLIFVGGSTFTVAEVL